MLKVLGILQARSSSRRFPSKIFSDLLGMPMLVRQVERLRRSERIDNLVVATSIEDSDDPVVELCEFMGVDCYRGSLNDVLDRVYHCAKAYEPRAVLRLTGDYPLIDGLEIDCLIDLFQSTRRLHYASNCRPPTYPDGFDAEIFSMEALSFAWSEASSRFDREHVTPFIVRNSDLFPSSTLELDVDYSHFRLTVDYEEDLAVVREIFESLYPTNPAFGIWDIIKFLNANPHLLKINQQYSRAVT